MRQRESLEKHCVKSLLVVYVRVCPIDSKRQFLCPLGANDQLAPPHWEKMTSLRGPYLGYGRIAVLPSINLKYLDKQAQKAKSLKGYPSQWVGTEQDEALGKIDWQPNPPDQVRCMASWNVLSCCPSCRSRWMMTQSEYWGDTSGPAQNPGG